MKTKTKLITLLGLVVLMASCMQSPEGERVKTGDAIEIDLPKDAISINANINESSIKWLGTKPTGTHYGTLSIKEGTLYVKDGELLAGSFTMDMNSIVVEDIKDPEMNQRLLNHLESEDFFLVDSFPTATFVFSNIQDLESDQIDHEEELKPTHRIEGNLTMRGITKKVNFPAKIKVSDKGVEAITPQFILNRTDWNVNYGSRSVFANLKDNFIHDEIGITISLKTE